MTNLTDLTQPKERLTLRKILNNSIVSYGLAVLMAFIASGIFIALMGYDVLKAYQTIFTVSFRTPNGFIQTLLKFIPLTLLALAFTVPFTTGKFNIGGEGQMLVGAIAATTVGILVGDLPKILLLPLVLLTGAVAGGIWGLIPGWLLYRFRINEILTTVLLNFVSFALLNFVATEIFPDPAAGHPTTVPIGKGGWLPMLVSNPPLHSGLILMLIVAVVIYFYIRHTTGGFELV
ncbi:MAG: ABC transporter permease, partial [Anaerolineales bacterium]|nr:ABC transporter permease [Anaerolineales bacterium]